MAGKAERELAGFIAKFSPEIAACTRACVAKMKRLIPGAVILVYDNYNALAIGFGSGEKQSTIVCSIAVYPRWVSLFLMNGPQVPDPTKLLKGSGTMVRHVVLDAPEALDRREIRALITAAIAIDGDRIDPAQPHRVVVKSISARQRPRRPAPVKVAKRRR